MSVAKGDIIIGGKITFILLKKVGPWLPFIYRSLLLEGVCQVRGSLKCFRGMRKWLALPLD